jgi:hypothetical protein
MFLNFVINGCSILDTRYWILDTRYLILSTGIWKKESLPAVAALSYYLYGVGSLFFH